MASHKEFAKGFGSAAKPVAIPLAAASVGYGAGRFHGSKMAAKKSREQNEAFYKKHRSRSKRSSQASALTGAYLVFTPAGSRKSVKGVGYGATAAGAYYIGLSQAHKKAANKPRYQYVNGYRIKTKGRSLADYERTKAARPDRDVHFNKGAIKVDSKPKTYYNRTAKPYYNRTVKGKIQRVRMGRR